MLGVVGVIGTRIIPPRPDLAAADRAGAAPVQVAEDRDQVGRNPPADGVERLRPVDAGPDRPPGPIPQGLPPPAPFPAQPIVSAFIDNPRRTGSITVEDAPAVSDINGSGPCPGDCLYLGFEAAD